MTADLADQVTAVVGGTKGIGAAIAVDLGAAGATVFVVGRDLDAAAEVVGAIGAAAGSAHSVACDVTVPGDCERLVETVAETSGRLDTLFANQGVARPSRRLVEWSPTDVAISLDVNLVGCLSLARAAHPLLTSDGGGLHRHRLGLRTPEHRRTGDVRDLQGRGFPPGAPVGPRVAAGHDSGEQIDPRPGPHRHDRLPR